MKIAITGAGGLIGSALTSRLQRTGHRLLRLTRPRRAAGESPARPGTARWDPIAGTIDHSALEGLDAVVHLAGESIASGRWTRAKKARADSGLLVGHGYRFRFPDLASALTDLLA